MDIGCPKFTVVLAGVPPNSDKFGAIPDVALELGIFEDDVTSWDFGTLKPLKGDVFVVPDILN